MSSGTGGSPLTAGAVASGAATSAKQDTGNNTLSTISSQLPATLGAKPAAASVSFAPATDALFGVNLTQVGGGALTLGQKTQANSIPVALSSDGQYATSANQTGTGAGAQTAQGADASGSTAIAKPIGVGAVYRATLPTFTDGQRADLQTTSRGQLLVSVASGFTITDGAGNSSFAGPIAGGTSASGLMVAGMRCNGLGWDRDRKPNIISRLTASASTGSPTVVKTSGADVSHWGGLNGAAVTFLQIYNKGSAAPVLGTDTPAYTYQIPANANFQRDFTNGGLYLPNGVSFAFTTDAAGTTAAAANAVTAFNLIAA